MSRDFREFTTEENMVQQCHEIFDNNNASYVADRSAIASDKVKVACMEDDIVLGYLTLYQGNDFCEQERFPLTMNIREDSLYIWHIITSKDHTGKGVASGLLNYTRVKYMHRPIYSCVDLNNYPSMKCHCNHGYVPIHSFRHTGMNKTADYLMLYNESPKRKFI